MGQRLVINIAGKSNDENVVAYYHWIGYSNTAATLTNNIVRYIIGAESDDADKLELAIKALETTGAGILEDERIKLQSYPQFSKYKIQDAVDCYTGLIFFSREGMIRAHNLAQAHVYIDMVSRTVNMRTCFACEWIHDDDDDMAFNSHAKAEHISNELLRAKFGSKEMFDKLFAESKSDEELYKKLYFVGLIRASIDDYLRYSDINTIHYDLQSIGFDEFDNFCRDIRGAAGHIFKDKDGNVFRQNSL